MNSKATNQDERSEQLRADYREAFGEWASQVAALQVANRTEPRGDTVRQFQTSTAEAESDYRKKRDRMADDMESDGSGTR